MLKIIQLNFPFDKPQNNFFTNPQNSSLSCRMCTAFPVTGTDYQRQGLVWGLPNSHLHRGSFPHQVQVCPLVPSTCWFSCLAAPPIDCFSNKLALCAQTVFSKQSLCSPSLRKSAKGLPEQADKPALWSRKVMELCKSSVLHEWQLPLQVLRGQIAHKHQIQTLYDLQ